MLITFAWSLRSVTWSDFCACGGYNVNIKSSCLFEVGTLFGFIFFEIPDFTRFKCFVNIATAWELTPEWTPSSPDSNAMGFGGVRFVHLSRIFSMNRLNWFTCCFIIESVRVGAESLNRNCLLIWTWLTRSDGGFVLVCWLFQLRTASLTCWSEQRTCWKR